MENIFTATKPFLSFAKVFGLFPMSFEGRARKGVLKVHWHDLLMLFISSSIHIALFMTMTTSYKTPERTSIILSHGWKILSNCGVFFGPIHFCYQIYNRKNILKILISIQNVDKEVKTVKHLLVEYLIKYYFSKISTLNLQMKYKLHKKLIYGTVFSSVAVVATMSLSVPVVIYLFGHEVPLSWDKCLPPAVLNLQKVFYVLQLVLFAWLIERRFHALNEYLSGKHFWGVYKVPPMKRFPIFQLSVIYHNLCDLIEVVNEAFTFHMMLQFLNILVRLNIKKESEFT